MKNLPCIALFISLLAFASCRLISCNSGNLNNWQPLNIGTNGLFRPLGIVSNAKAILTFGYNEDGFNCGFLGVQNCRKFKIFRSMDQGETWTDISNPNLEELHGIAKGDKLMPRLLARLSQRYATVIYLGKQIFDFAMYTETTRSGAYFADGNTFYMYQDFILYESSDLGASWQEDSIDYGYPLPIHSNSTIDIINGNLLVHDVNSGEKFVFKKEGNLFKFQQNNNFYIIHHHNGKKELKFEGEDPLCNHFTITKDKKNNYQLLVPIQGYNSKNFYLVSELYYTKEKYIIANCKANLSDSLIGNFVAFLSKDKGKTFGYESYPLNLSYDGLEGFSVKGFCGGYPLAIQCLRDISYDHHLITSSCPLGWNMKKKQAIFLQIPEVASGLKGFISDIYITPKYLYYYCSGGLFRHENK